MKETIEIGFRTSFWYENKIVVIPAQDVQEPASEPGRRIGRVDNFIEVKKLEVLNPISCF